MALQVLLGLAAAAVAALAEDLVVDQVAAAAGLRAAAAAAAPAEDLVVDQAAAVAAEAVLVVSMEMGVREWATRTTGTLTAKSRRT